MHVLMAMKLLSDLTSAGTLYLCRSQVHLSKGAQSRFGAPAAAIGAGGAVLEGGHTILG